LIAAAVGACTGRSNYRLTVGARTGHSWLSQDCGVRAVRAVGDEQAHGLVKPLPNRYADRSLAVGIWVGGESALMDGDGQL